MTAPTLLSYSSSFYHVKHVYKKDGRIHYVRLFSGNEKSGRIPYVRFRFLSEGERRHCSMCLPFIWRFLSEQSRMIGVELLVGLLTDVSRRSKNRHRVSVAFPAKPLRPPVTCFRRKRIHSTNTAIELHVCRNFRLSCCCKTCSGLSPDSLVQPNKDACPFHNVERVAHLPQKPDVIFSFTSRNSQIESPRANAASNGDSFRKVFRFLQRSDLGFLSASV